ncbi:6-phosphogluconolactonase [Edwardsiella tarda]
MVTFNEVQSAQALNEQLADDIAARLRQGIAARGQASLVVSGGRTPLGLFARLSQQALDWSRVTITLADERWVAPQDEASNERLVREHLLQGRPRQRVSSG